MARKIGAMNDQVTMFYQQMLCVYADNAEDGHHDGCKHYPAVLEGVAHR